MTTFKRIEKHYKLSDDEFEQQFRDCQFAPVQFTHEAHLRLAFIHILKYGEDQAILNIREQLKKYVAFAGEEGKYHETVTVASIREISTRQKDANLVDFKTFIIKYPELMNHFKSVINSKYYFYVIISAKARVN
jgi:hypothetical protein